MEGDEWLVREHQSSQVAVGRFGSPRRRACSEPARRAANEVWTYFWSRSLKDQAVRPLQQSSREFFSQPDGGFLRSLEHSAGAIEMPTLGGAVALDDLYAQVDWIAAEDAV